MSLNNGRKAGNTTKYLILLSIFLLLVDTTLGAILVNYSGKALKSLMNSRMLDISNTAADMLDGDILKDLTPEDEGTEAYDSTMRILKYFQDNIELEYIYCIRDKGDGNFVFGLDPTEIDPGVFDAPVVYTDALYRASLGTPSVDDAPYEDEWGSFYSAYSPVFDSAGKVAGIVAVDFSRQWYDNHIADLTRTVIMVSIASLIFGAAIVLILTSRERKSIQRVHAQLNELADNVEKLVDVVEGNDSAKDDPGAENREITKNGAEDIDSLRLKILFMQEELRQKITEVREQAYLDAMTGVGNKTSYLKAERKMEELMISRSAGFSIVIFDMNGLKTINDQYGHSSGDQALKDAADILIAVYGKDSLYRVGGDEFIAVLVDKTEEDIKSGLSRVDELLIEENKKERPDRLNISLSRGYAIYSPEEDGDFKDVIRRADKNMYADKAAYYMKHGDRRKKRDQT